MTWIYTIASLLSTAWIWHAFLLNMWRTFGGDPDSHWTDLARWIVSELRPFYLPATLVIIAVHSLRGELLGWNAPIDALRILNWFFYKDEGDDGRWKRRRAKLAAKVRALASGRLVAVPAGSPA